MSKWWKEIKIENLQPGDMIELMNDTGSRDCLIVLNLSKTVYDTVILTSIKNDQVHQGYWTDNMIFKFCKPVHDNEG